MKTRPRGSKIAAGFQVARAFQDVSEELDQGTLLRQLRSGIGSRGRGGDSLPSPKDGSSSDGACQDPCAMCRSEIRAGVLQARRSSEGCLHPGKGASSGISGQDPQGLAVSARRMEIMRWWSFLLLSWQVTTHAPTANPPTLPCKQLKG